MPSLRQIDFINASCSGLKDHLDFIAESRNSHFPSLNAVRILDLSYSLTPADYFIIPSHFLDILRDWTKATETLGIELQNHRGDAVKIHRRYRMLDRGEYLSDIPEYEHDIDFEEESDDTYESPTSEDDYSCSESDVSFSCLSDHPEGSHPEPEMDHDTVLRLWDQMREDEGDDEMSDSSECTD
ncbi:hypothetical protein BD410DRAFT_903301 [Rickenella mellea]|uniref:Uncharacterized protein n=1 Tax=Rickenella mellea TaxID=50990 RepID=A0A4Y7PDV0_9AGAM|nr:hypothetical protein BD410DRAFT_903303 [Rickenella mellea]TDL13447.1 hypothetical protein BD410DRAFT_903301 [Rickenella mellea]